MMQKVMRDIGSDSRSAARLYYDSRRVKSLMLSVTESCACQCTWVRDAFEQTVSFLSFSLVHFPSLSLAETSSPGGGDEYIF